MIVIDSSVALQWVLPEPGSASAEALLGHADLVAPDILIIEVANVLAKKVRAGDMSLEQALSGVQLVRDAVPLLDSSVELAATALRLSVELSHPVYDCSFLACAIARDAAIATRDRPFIDRLVRGGYKERVQPGYEGAINP